MSKKRICLLAVGLTLLLAAGFFLALPRTLFDEPFSATVWSRDGRLLSAKVAPDGQWRFFPTDSVPGKFRTAITTYEDKRFDRHFGVDPLALARAVGQNLAAGRIESGASTLTMQTIRLSRGGKPRTFGEKFVEAVLALRLEMRCSKEEILALYAAHAPFGGNVVGLESASWYYFGRSARDLSWAESALLAVLPNAPSLIHMKRNRERLREKRDRLLDRIRSGGHIDSLTCALAKLEPLPEAPEPMPMEAMHLLGKMRTGALRSTLDADLQGRVNALARRYNAQYRGNRINNLAVVVMDVRSGEVLAYAGNVYDPGDRSAGTGVDVIPARRSSGSVLKPILYAGMLDDGTALPTMLFPDVPTYYRDFTPQNYNRTFDGAVPANRVVERSLNVPSVRMLDQIRPGEFSVAGAGAGFPHDRPQRRPLRAVADLGRRGDHAVGPHGRLYADGGQTRRAGDDPPAALRRVVGRDRCGRRHSPLAGCAVADVRGDQPRHAPRGGGRVAVFCLVEEDRLEDRDELRQPRRMGRRGDARLRRGRLGRELFGRRAAADDGRGVRCSRPVRGVRPAARERVVRRALR